MYFFSKAVWALLQPAHLIVFALMAGWTMVLFRRSRRAGLWLGSASILVLAVLALVPVGDWLMRPLENRFPAPAAVDRVDGILVMGGGQNPQVSHDRDSIALNDSAERMIDSAALALRFPEARLVFSGGNGPVGMTEADVAWRVYGAMGLDPDAIIYDSRSRNTWESAVNLRSFVTPRPGEVWLLLTSAFHMPRSVAVFRAEGWDIVPYPVDFRVTREADTLWDVGLDGNLRTLTIALHEYVGLLSYRLLGRTEELFPEP
ncbi:MAG: YdcF family protein [Proteobacteria bacterium]|nr:YdcF family protein [Pseudomonadota bacterium]MDA1072194.1 YdcF family protein [Pseudomonadota bacterium]